MAAVSSSSGTADRLPAAARVALIGLGITNAAAARALVRRGYPIVLTDDGPPESGAELSAELAADFVASPSGSALEGLLADCDFMLPAPGLPESHPAFSAAAQVNTPVISEFDLASCWDGRDVLAITGTNGKTTVVTLVVNMLTEAGIATEAVGNLEVPLVAAIDDPAPECFVVEASSFRLGHSRWFAPKVGTWLNFAPDHLDVHADMDSYRDAKASIWTRMGPGGTAVVCADDAVVAAAAPESGPRVWRFGIGGQSDLDFTEVDGSLVGPDGVVLAGCSELPRDLPHDRSNALAAAATASAVGADVAAMRRALVGFGGLPHRVQLVGENGGVRFYDDSKATAPHATLAAAGGFERVVLVAGGRNKGLDLSELSAADSVNAVVGIGEAAQEVLDAFAPLPGRIATTMREAVAEASQFAAEGDVVLLSPGCASFDWYRGYGERGDDFAAEVRLLIAGEESR